MKQLLLLLILSIGVALPRAAHAQQAPAAAPARPTYGEAEVLPGLGGWSLILSDDTTPNPKSKIFEQDGKNCRLETEAAIFNFLDAQGWKVLPNESLNSGTRRYLLERRTP